MTESARAIHPYLKFTMAAFLAATSVFAQTDAKPPAETKAVPSDKSAAYYNFAMGHLYAELAGAYGNRGEYLNKAIDAYKEALRLDPSASFLSEELTDLYIQSGQLNRAVTEAEALLKQNPDNLDARRVLGRIYTRLIGDTQTNKVDENMLNKSIEQYKIITEKDKNDLESRVILGRLYLAAHNSVEAEKIYKSVLEAEPDNEEALTGLASVYSGLGDTKGAIEMLRRASEKNPNVRSLGALASFYEQTNDYAAAAETLKRMIPLAPDNNRIKRALAQDLLYSDKIDESLALYKEIAAEDPRDPSVQLNLSRIYRQKGDFDKSRAALVKAKEIDPANLDVKYEEVNLLDSEGKNDAAIVVLKGIIADKNTDPSAKGKLTERLGILYRASGKYPEAVAAFRELGETDPEQASHAAVQVIETYRAEKKLPEARKEMEAALKKYPKDRSVMLENASLLAEQGKTTEAVAVFRNLMGPTPDRDLLLAIAQVYEKAKKYPEEQKVLDEAEAASKSKQEKQGVLFARGAMYERMKNFDAAEAEFRKVLTNDPDNAGALNYLGYMLADRDVRLDEALKMIQRALELEPGNGAYLDSLGWVYFRQNQLQLAEDQLRKALEKIGTDPTVHDHLGDVYAKAGKTRDAITQWQTSLKEWEKANSADADPQEIAKVTKKLEDARVRVAKEGKPDQQR
jgi:tetratricopeptide (TPR) repeat protein